MPESTCVKCGNHSFIGRSFELDRPVIFVQCSSCGGVVGVLEDMNLKTEFENIWAKLTEIEVSMP